MVLAARGVRKMNGEEEKIEDPETLAQIRRQARKVYAETTLAAALLTALFVALPW